MLPGLQHLVFWQQADRRHSRPAMPLPLHQSAAGGQPTSAAVEVPNAHTLLQHPPFAVPASGS